MNVEHRKTAGSRQKKRKYRILGVSETPAARLRGSEPGVARDGASDEPEQAVLDVFTKSRHERIAETAYFKAERRGFQGGDPDRDWREAEMEVEEMLRRGRPF